MKVVAISGSPRMAGNTSFLLNNLSEMLVESGLEGEVLHLSSYNILPCDGCLNCENAGSEGVCPIKDDMSSEIMPRLLSADAWVIGTPTYFDMPTGILKNFIDRTNSFLSSIALKKLLCGIVVVGQTDLGSLDAAYSCLKRYCSICQMRETIGSPVTVIARDVGEAANNRKAIEDITTLSKSLSSLLMKS